jgi:hypothetical protein
LIVLVIVRTLQRESPAGAWLVTLDPPAVKHGEVHHTVHRGLFSGCSGSLQRSCRVVHPHIDTLHKSFGDGNVVAWDEDDLADEAVQL